MARRHDDDSGRAEQRQREAATSMPPRHSCHTHARQTSAARREVMLPRCQYQRQFIIKRTIALVAASAPLDERTTIGLP